jgi:hypothetical protein
MGVGATPEGEENCIFSPVVVKENLLDIGEKKVSQRNYSIWRKL